MDSFSIFALSPRCWTLVLPLLALAPRVEAQEQMQHTFSIREGSNGIHESKDAVTSYRPGCPCFGFEQVSQDDPRVQEAEKYLLNQHDFYDDGDLQPAFGGIYMKDPCVKQDGNGLNVRTVLILQMWVDHSGPDQAPYFHWEDAYYFWVEAARGNSGTWNYSEITERVFIPYEGP